jgi:DNA-binding FrmR family transcriptional regulator
MAHGIQEGQGLLARVGLIRGQTEALRRALEPEAECPTVLHRIAAIPGAVDGLMGVVHEGRPRDHLGTPDRTPQQRREGLGQVVSVLRSYLE